MDAKAKRLIDVLNEVRAGKPCKKKKGLEQLAEIKLPPAVPGSVVILPDQPQDETSHSTYAWSIK